MKGGTPIVPRKTLRELGLDKPKARSVPLSREYRRTRITVRFDRAHAPSKGIPNGLHRKLTARGAFGKFVAAGLKAIGVPAGRLTNFWQGIEAIESKPRAASRRRCSSDAKKGGR